MILTAMSPYDQYSINTSSQVAYLCAVSQRSVGEKSSFPSIKGYYCGVQLVIMISYKFKDQPLSEALLY